MFQAIDSQPLTDQDLQIFEATVPADHYLRRVKAAIDFQRLAAPLAVLYHPTLGRPAFDPIRMIQLEFLQFHYGLSDREVIQECRVNMAFRFFLGLSLRDALPDPSLLTHFRNRLGEQAHRQLFHDLITQARALGLVRDRVRVKDATHIMANIAVPSALTLVAQARDRLLDAARFDQPERVAQEEAEVERLRTVTSDLADAARLVHRVHHLRAILAWAEERVARGEQRGSPRDPSFERLRQAVAVAHQVLAGHEVPKASDKILSVEDPDARQGWHHQWYTGFLLDITEDPDSELVTAIDVLPANADEAANATALIQQEEQAHGNDVETLSIDSVGFRGDLLSQWTDPEGLDLEVIVPPIAYPASGVFPPERFVLDPDGRTLRCPADQTTRDRQRSPNDTGWKYRFGAPQCAGCALRRECLAKPEQTRARTVIKNDYEAVYRTFRAKSQTPRYRAVRAEHSRVERKLGELARWHGARRARYRGRAKVTIQALLTGLVVNAKRMVKLIAAAATSCPGMVRAACATS